MSKKPAKFQDGERAFIIQYGKDKFMAQVVPCIIGFEVSKDGFGDRLYHVMLFNGQGIESFEDDIFTEKEAITRLRNWMKAFNTTL